MLPEGNLSFATHEKSPRKETEHVPQNGNTNNITTRGREAEEKAILQARRSLRTLHERYTFSLGRQAINSLKANIKMDPSTQPSFIVWLYVMSSGSCVEKKTPYVKLVIEAGDWYERADSTTLTELYAKAANWLPQRSDSNSSVPMPRSEEGGISDDIKSARMKLMSLSNFYTPAFGLAEIRKLHPKMSANIKPRFLLWLYAVNLIVGDLDLRMMQWESQTNEWFESLEAKKLTELYATASSCLTNKIHSETSSSN